MVWVELECLDINHLAVHFMRWGMGAARCRCRDACDCHEAVGYYADRASKLYET